MPSNSPIVDAAELAVLMTGVLVIAVGAAVWARPGRRGEALALPEPLAHRLEPLDLLGGLAVVLLLPNVFASLFSWLVGEAATTQAAAGQATSAPAQVAPTALGVAASAGGQLGAAVVLAVLARAKFSGGLAGWGLRWERLPTQIRRAVLAYLALWPVCASLLWLTVVGVKLLNPTYEPTAHEALRAFRAEGQSGWVRAVVILSAVVLAPLVEEMLFRGLLQTGFARWGRSQWKAIIISGLAFGLFHWDVGYTVPALAFFGIVLAYCYAKTQSLTMVILLHAVFNGKTMLWLALSG